jgi:hypothetical protein
MTEFIFGDPILPTSHFPYKMILVFSMKAVVFVAPLKVVPPRCVVCYSGVHGLLRVQFLHYHTLSK